MLYMQLSALGERVDEVMMLKFGQIVDLKKLEVLQSNPVLEEKRALLQSLEREGMKEVDVLRAEVEQKRRELKDIMLENTARLKRKYHLVTMEREMGIRLDARQKSMVRVYVL